MLEQKEKELIEAIRKNKQEQEAGLPVKKESLELLLETMNHCRDYTQCLLRDGNSAEIASTYQPVSSRLSFLLKYPLPSPPETTQPALQFTREKKKIQDIFSSLNQLVFPQSSSSPRAEETPSPLKDPFSPSKPTLRLRQRQKEKQGVTYPGNEDPSSDDNPSSDASIPGYSFHRKLGISDKETLHLKKPGGMAVDSDEKIYIADAGNNQIQCLDSAGTLSLLGKKGSEEGEFSSPHDIAYDLKNQRLLVADSGNHRIQVFSMKGEFLFCFGSKGEGERQFVEPCGIAVDQGGNIYVSDTGNNRVLVFNEKADFLRQIGQGELRSPHGLGILSDGNLVVSESLGRHKFGKLRIFNDQGVAVGSIGEGKLNNSFWLMIDPRDNIIVGDNRQDNRVVKIFSKNGEELEVFGKALFNRISGFAMKKSGDILVSGTAKNNHPSIFVFVKTAPF